MTAEDKNVCSPMEERERLLKQVAKTNMLILICQDLVNVLLYLRHINREEIIKFTVLKN